MSKAKYPSRGRPLSYIYTIVSGTWSKANKRLDSVDKVLYSSTDMKASKAELFRRRKVWREQTGSLANHIRLLRSPIGAHHEAITNNAETEVFL